MVAALGKGFGIQALTLPYILTLGFVLRVIWAFMVPIDPVSDSNIYDMFAQRIAAGDGYTWPDGTPTVYWAVGASAIYSVAYFLFGHSLIAAAFLNIALGTLLILAVYKLARTRFNVDTSRLAALLAAIWPSWIAFTTILSSELPSVLFVTVGMALFMSEKHSFLLRTILGSLCLVAASFVRPTALPLILAVPVLTAIVSGKWRLVLAGSAVALLVASAALTPWALRNQTHFGKPVLISANFGANLWMGNNPASNGGYMPLPQGLPKNEVTRDDLLKQRALNFIVANPGRYFELCLRRIKLSFDRETIGVAWNQNSLPEIIQLPLKLVMSSYWLVVLGLSLVGLALFLWRKPIRLFDPLTVASGLFACVPILVVGMDRYHFGLMPFVAIFAAFSIRAFSNREGSFSMGMK